MSKMPGLNQVGRRPPTESLHKALDEVYRQMLQADEQFLFIRENPSDGCVSVRISKPQIAEELAAITRIYAGPPKKRKPTNRKSRREQD